MKPTCPKRVLGVALTLVNSNDHCHECPSPEEALDVAITQARNGGLRRTSALKAVLSAIISTPAPVTLAELCEHPKLSGSCDKATVYRLLTRLHEKRILRKIGLHDRSARFVLQHGDHHHDYLVCTECGSIEVLEIACPVEALEKEVSKRSGSRGIYHELEFFGLCPTCA